jgi:hypothetical protein
LANPLEHQCSCATISPGAGLNFGVEFAAPGAVFKGLVLPCRPLDGHEVFPRLVDDLADCIRYRATITLLTPLKQALSDHLFDRVVEELSSVGQRGVGYFAASLVTVKPSTKPKHLSRCTIVALMIRPCRLRR